MECKICGIQNKTNNIFFTEEYYRVIINNIWFGSITETKLNIDLYLETANKLIEKVDLILGQFNEETEEFDVRIGMIDNLYAFSAAKQYQFIREVKEKEFDNFIEFFENAEKIFKRYYEDYLNTEIDSAEYQAISAKDWLNIVRWNNE